MNNDSRSAETRREGATYLPCTKCNGKGTIFHKGFSFTEDDGTVKTYPDRDSECYACHGTREFEIVDATVLDRLLALLTTTRGCGGQGRRSEVAANKGAAVRRFKKTCPVKGNPFGKAVTRDERRAYYIWRMARFHGGVDVCMPMTAMSMVDGDPWVKILDLISDTVAMLQFGTALGAAARWGCAFGMIDKAPNGLPAGAYEGGPVADEFKPLFECAELR